ncbi:MAG: hypothetical protein J6W49_07555 [Paludibacteraceae bacterium]|nr:hypothetical protein [Paludibacteraceae bacterium]
MKTNIKSALIVILSVLFTSVMTACGDDDDKTSAPVVVLTEANYESAENEVCVQANISAEGLIASLGAVVLDKDGRQVGESYSDSKTYAGVKATDGVHFHIHNVVIADVATVADYKLRLTVTDKRGQQTTVEQALGLEEEDE